MRACLFNIQKFSLHDGPGIRTTVFFKGCPLRCLWCANPESLRRRPEVLWRADRCVGCGACEAACREQAIALSDGAARVDRARCVGCGDCARACPAEALSVAGRMWSLDEVVRECLRDKDFYAESGGGVTLSGGEVTLHAEFAGALLHRLRVEGVHTAIETNGHAARENFRAVAEAADLLLFDIKHHDAARHREGTGVDNAVILDNLAWAVASGREVLARIPVIRGYSDTLEDAAAFAALLAGANVRRVQLLPFHQMGEGKFAQLGMEYALGGREQMRKEELEPYARVMRNTGVGEVIL